MLNWPKINSIFSTLWNPLKSYQSRQTDGRLTKVQITIGKVTLSNADSCYQSTSFSQFTKKNYLKLECSFLQILLYIFIVIALEKLVTWCSIWRKHERENMQNLASLSHEIETWKVHICNKFLCTTFSATWKMYTRNGKIAYIIWMWMWMWSYVE